MAYVSGGDRMGAALDAIAKKLKNASKVEVGFHADATYPDGTSVAMVAAIQNFGAPSVGIPPRPFFSNVVKAGRKTWGPKLAKVLKAADYDADIALGRMGARIQGEIQKSITDMNDPPLSPVTLLLRERFGNHPEEIRGRDVAKAREDISSGAVPEVTPTQSKPLVWTGVMQNAVDYKVE